jgi:hypothetical protein
MNGGSRVAVISHNTSYRALSLRAEQIQIQTRDDADPTPVFCLLLHHNHNAVRVAIVCGVRYVVDVQVNVL